MNDTCTITNEILGLAVKGLLFSSEPKKRFKKRMAIIKIKSQPFFGKADYDTVTFRRPIPYKFDVIGKAKQ